MILQNEITRIVIYGASGFGREVLWTIRDCNDVSKKYEILGFIDDDESLSGKIIDELPVLGGINWFSEKISKNVECVIAISDSKLRQQIVGNLKKYDVKFTSIIHPTVIYSKFVEIGEGTIIQAGCVITTNVKIGNHVHVNITSTIGHDTIIKDFVTINPGVHVNGNTLVEEGVYLGTGVILKNIIHIGQWSIIGAGTVIISNVPEFSMYVGVPGQLKKTLI